ncbi:hypothetical protein Taro_039166 [Colocasia esculenta]|uniref:Uncharacterized protein n=1 Tax=Colocasia esculenta TaxID=4460 RepID=A0A843WPD1_COLES|nr:hypothetical protein [Colocasia esculenta]
MNTLVVLQIHTLNSDLLNPMYQARTQKAAVEFFWTADQAVSNLLKGQLDYGSSILPEGDLSCWESNILWSLKQYQNIEKPLVLWDILAALLALKQTAPGFVEQLLLNWLSSWCLDLPSGFTLENILFHVQSSLPKINNHQIHLLNIICRRLIFSELKIEVPKSGEPYNEDKLNLWNELLIHSEKEMRVRLVCFSLGAALFLASRVSEASASNRKWLPVGVAQMERWVTINKELIEDRLLLLVLRVGELGERIKNVCDNQVKESCGLCSASVPFESPETAVCKATKSANHSVKSHKLQRCAVSMKLCSITNVPWFCTCCQRWAARLMPNAFFTKYNPSVDFGYVIESFTLFDHSKPLCPFCGIQLQRHAPNFLLAVNPV